MGNRFLACVRANHPVKALVGVAADGHIVTENVEHSDHLTENQNAMTIRTEAGQKLVDQEQLAAVHQHVLQHFLVVGSFRFCAVEQIWVVGSLLEFHRCRCG